MIESKSDEQVRAKRNGIEHRRTEQKRAEQSRLACLSDGQKSYIDRNSACAPEMLSRACLS